ncbi:MAG: FAD:protein FMN transferase [Rhodospirillales bacterium]
MRRVAVPALAAPPDAPAAGARVATLVGETMGTTWTVRVAAPPDIDFVALRARIQHALDRVVAQMSTYRPDSDLSRFNAAPAGTWLALPEEFLAVLTAALALARETDGAFDPTVGPLVDLWGFGPAGRRTEPPPAAAIEAVAGPVGWARLEIDAARRRARQPGGVRLDLSAIAKGFGVDAVADCLRDAGLTCYLVEVGGELRGAGTKPDGKPWWVAPDRPRADMPETIVALHGLAVATSGDYRRFFDSGGIRYAHTIDPRTGRPVSHGLVAVTVLHPSCMQADALATALTVLGPQAGYDFACARGIAALFVARDGGGDRLPETMTPAFLAMLD